MADDSDAARMPQVYTLTSLTRSAGQSRRVVVAGFDAPLRGLLVTGLALAVSALPTAILWLFIGPSALFLSMLAVGAAFYLVESRTRSGLQLRTYQAMIDKRRENIGQFLCCGKAVQPSMSGYGLLVRSSMPSPHLVSASDQVELLINPELTGSTPIRPAPPRPSVERKKLPSRDGARTSAIGVLAAKVVAVPAWVRSIIVRWRLGRRAANPFELATQDLVVQAEPAKSAETARDSGFARGLRFRVGRSHLPARSGSAPVKARAARPDRLLTEDVGRRKLGRSGPR